MALIKANIAPPGDGGLIVLCGACYRALRAPHGRRAAHGGAARARWRRGLNSVRATALFSSNTAQEGPDARFPAGARTAGRHRRPRAGVREPGRRGIFTEKFSIHF